MNSEYGLFVSLSNT